MTFIPARYRMSSSSVRERVQRMTGMSPLLFALVIRSLSLLRQTYFQPDEFFQALEPAHWLIFGKGYLSWEWRGERIRSWIWPSVFAAVYKLLVLTGLDQTVLLTLAPRVVCVCMAACTDYYTYLLASKLLGHGAAPASMFLSLTSLFHAHALPRAAGTSIETMLTVMALYYWPLPTSPPAQSVPKRSAKGDIWTQIPPQSESVDMATVDADLPDAYQPRHQDSLALSLGISAVAFCIRPTNIFLWSFLGLELLWRKAAGRDAISAARGTMKLISLPIAVGLAVLAASTALDYAVTGSLALPPLTFLQQNLYQNISSFYGASSPLYHLTQTLPILLTTSLPFFFPAFFKALSPSSSSPPALRTLAWTVVWTFAAWSALPHAEWRFLHPILPILLLFCAQTLVTSFTTVPAGAMASLPTAARCYTRINRTPFWWLLLSPIVPAIYLNAFHGRAQITSIEWLRTQNNVTSVVELMPCHSTPWMSHLHLHDAADESWFLTCEPPLGVDPAKHVTQQDLFYASPATYLNTTFPTPPGGHRSTPSHLVMFGCLLDEQGVKSALASRGYRSVWSAWNGFDLLQDEEKRRGGVAIWAK